MTQALLFSTNFKYHDRETKSKYVWLKYMAILHGQSILDVGADQCFLKGYLDNSSTYWGIGLGKILDQHVNLETERIPIQDNSYDTVLCLDVLEHIENIHEIFDELCRVSRRYVVISLPNAWYNFIMLLRSNDQSPPLKFYGLPLEYPEDRHKWFFSAEEAEAFIAYRAKKNNMRIVQLDYSFTRSEGRRPQYLLKRLAKRIFINPYISLKNTNAATLWVVLEKANVR